MINLSSKNSEYLVDVDLVSANAKSSKVKGKLSGLWYFGVSGSLAGSEEIVALLEIKKDHFYII